MASSSSYSTGARTTTERRIKLARASGSFPQNARRHDALFVSIARCGIVPNSPVVAGMSDQKASLMLLRESMTPKAVAGYGRQSRASLGVMNVILRNVDEVMTVFGDMLFPPPTPLQ